MADLRKELCNVKKLLGDEQRRCKESGQRISETQFMFGQMLKDYNSAVDQLNQLQQEKRIKVSDIQSQLCYDLVCLCFTFNSVICSVFSNPTRV